LGNRAGLIAVGVWLSTHFIADEYRKSMADPFVAFFTLVCVWAWTRASAFSPRAHAGSVARAAPFALAPRDPAGVPGVPGSLRGLNGKWIVLFYISLSLGALSKGPVIFITVLIALLAIHLIHRRRVGPWWVHLLGLLLFLAITLPWPLYIHRHVPNALDIWRYESVGEMTGENVEKARPWWMYIGNSFQLPLPWTPLWIGGIVITFVHGRRGLHGRRTKRLLVPILWQVLTVLFFSLSSVKKPAYLLPAMPAQTLIIAEAIVILLAFGKRAWFRGMPGLVATAQALIGVGFALGMSLLLVRSTMDRKLAIACAAVAVFASLCAFVPIARRAPRNWFANQVLAYAVILIVLLGFQRPVDENRRSSRRFAAGLTQYLHESNLPLMVHSIPEDLAIYLPLDLPDADGLPHALLAVDHSPKDPPETLGSLSRLLGDTAVIDARPVSLPGVDEQGRWRLFEVTLANRNLRV
jgi:4-amino-4-deoxy-L-arabinose transferase-like glycosyltransferase